MTYDITALFSCCTVGTFPSPPSLLVSFAPIIHQNHIQAFTLQGRSDQASSHSEASPRSSSKRPSPYKPGAFVKAEWPLAIRGWKTITLFFLFLWHPLLSLPFSLFLADRWWESCSRSQRPLGFGWLTRTSKQGATGEGAAGAEPEGGSWLGQKNYGGGMNEAVTCSSDLHINVNSLVVICTMLHIFYSATSNNQSG